MNSTQLQLAQQLVGALLAKLPPQAQPLAQEISGNLAALGAGELEQVIQDVTVALGGDLDAAPGGASDALSVLRRHMTIQELADEKQTLTQGALQMAADAQARSQAEQQILTAVIGAGLKALLAAVV